MPWQACDVGKISMACFSDALCQHACNLCQGGKVASCAEFCHAHILLEAQLLAQECAAELG